MSLLAHEAPGSAAGAPLVGRRVVCLGRLPYRLFAALMFCQELASDGREPSAVNAVVVENFFLASRHRMVVRKTHDFESGRDARLEQQPGAGLTQSAVHAVLLHGDHPTRFGGGFQYGRLVQAV